MAHPAAGYAPPSTSVSRAGRPLAIAGLVCAAVAVLFLPIVLGPVAVVLGVVAHVKGERLGRWAILAGVLGTIAGFALAAWVFAEARNAALALPTLTGLS